MITTTTEAQGHEPHPHAPYDEDRPERKRLEPARTRESRGTPGLHAAGEALRRAKDAGFPPELVSWILRP